jgi:hypothetical protein
MITLSAITIYPIKSCRALSLQESAIDRFGLVHDRRFMIVGPDGVALTQRDHPRLTLLDVRPVRTGLELKAPFLGSLEVPFTDPTRARRTVRIWDDTVQAEDCGDEAALFLERYLGATCRLVHMHNGFRRDVDGRYRRHEDDQTGFQDGYPFLLASEASLRDLSERARMRLTMNRFRSNLVVAGAQPYEEDTWKTIRIGSRVFHVVKPCARCVVTTIDPATGETGREPLATLATYRRNEKGDVLFAQNLLHEPGEGRVAVGMTVEVLEYKETR